MGRREAWQFCEQQEDRVLLTDTSHWDVSAGGDAPDHTREGTVQRGGRNIAHLTALLFCTSSFSPPPPPPLVLLFLSFIISVHQHLPWGGRSNQDGIVSLSCGKLCLGSTCQTLSDRGQSDFETLLMTLDSFSLTISSADLEEMYFILHTDDLSAASCGFSDNVGIKCFKEHLKWALL